ncbi:MAG: transglutaminase domain-containing protein [Candidatus Merdivicinus sp.]|jgi:transglutaminase-like putative cysteine protease
MRLSKFLAAALCAAVLATCICSCGLISESTYEQAEKFGNGVRDFIQPEESSQNSSPESNPESSFPETSGPDFQNSSPISPEPDYYRQHLTELEQREYDFLLAAAEKRQKTAEISTADEAILTAALRALYADHPEFFWMENGGSFYTSGSHSEYHFLLNSLIENADAAQQEIDTAVNEFLNTIPEDASDYQKVKLVFDFLVDSISYDVNSANSGNIYGALVEKKARCEGYARAAQYLLNKMNIFCTYVTGETTDGQPHGWNLLFLDGEFYHMDATWGDPSFTGETVESMAGYRNYLYLCATTEEILHSRTIDETYAAMPLCDSDTHSYFTESERWIADDSFSETFEPILRDAIQDQEPFVSVRFADPADLEQAISILFDQQQIYQLFTENQLSLTEVSYLTDPDFGILTIFLH